MTGAVHTRFSVARAKSTLTVIDATGWAKGRVGVHASLFGVVAFGSAIGACHALGVGVAVFGTCLAWACTASVGACCESGRAVEAVAFGFARRRAGCGRCSALTTNAVIVSTGAFFAVAALAAGTGAVALWGCGAGVVFALGASAVAVATVEIGRARRGALNEGFDAGTSFARRLALGALFAVGVGGALLRAFGGCTGFGTFAIDARCFVVGAAGTVEVVKARIWAIAAVVVVAAVTGHTFSDSVNQATGSVTVFAVFFAFAVTTFSTFISAAASNGKESSERKKCCNQSPS